MSTVAELLIEIEKRELILPEFQRGFVWSPTKVKNYVESIYRNYPTGHFLIWKTYKPQKSRGDAKASNTQYYRLILDGQQRLTALYTVFRGEPPPFFEGGKLYFRIFFNVLTQEFEFWQPVKMRGKPEWIEISPFLQEGLDKFLLNLDGRSEEEKTFYKSGRQLNNLVRLNLMKDYKYDLETVPKGDKEIETDEVVRIFNLVNSSGMTLSKGDLGLAHICASWPEARETIKSTHRRLSDVGFNLTTLKGREFEFWIRALAGVATDSVLLDGSFYKTDIESIKEAWPKITKSAEYLVNILRNDAYIDSSRQLTTPYVLLPLIKYLSGQGYTFTSEMEKRRFLLWLYTAQMWGRYSGPIETNLQKDVKALKSQDPVSELQSNIISRVGRIKADSKDLVGKGKLSTFFNMAYVAACNNGAIDWFNGIGLYTKNLGAAYNIEVHHIFPTSRLYKEGGLDSKNRADISKANEIANLAFLTKEANLKASDNLPSIYLPKVREKYPSALKAQFVPENHQLWEIKNYEAFLEARRGLIADGINKFMENLIKADIQIGIRSIADIIAGGENREVEFKSSLRWDSKLSQINKVLEMVTIKTIAGFLNTDGGILLIGVDDSRQILGIEDDFRTLKKADRDGYELHLTQLISSYIGKERCVNTSISFHGLDGKDLCLVQVEPSPKPAYVKEGQESKFYIRTGNQTQPLNIKESIEYIQEHWPE